MLLGFLHRSWLIVGWQGWRSRIRNASEFLIANDLQLAYAPNREEENSKEAYQCCGIGGQLRNGCGSYFLNFSKSAATTSVTMSVLTVRGLNLSVNQSEPFPIFPHIARGQPQNFVRQILIGHIVQTRIVIIALQWPCAKLTKPTDGQFSRNREVKLARPIRYALISRLPWRAAITHALRRYFADQILRSPTPMSYPCLMPDNTALPIDWAQAEALFCKGLSLREISVSLNCSLIALRKRQTRYKWSQRKTEVGQKVVHSVQNTLAEHAGAWLTQIDDYVHKVISKVQPENLGLKDLAIAVGIAETVDRMARRAYGLDAERSNTRQTLVQVQVTSNTPQSVSPIAIMDIESEAVLEPSNSSADNKANKPK